MKTAYLDTSAMVALLFGEPEAASIQTKLKQFDALISSDLFTAELSSVAAREETPRKDLATAFDSVALIFPDRSLAPELDRVLENGYLRGADLWHLACALFLDPKADELQFITLDQDQNRIAKKVGFTTPCSKPPP